MIARVFGGVARSSESPIPVLRAAECDVGIGSLVTFTRASSGYRYNAAGLMELMGVNVPRVSRRPVTLAVLGYLFEEQRSNVQPRYNALNQSAWSKTRSSVSADVFTAPDGTLTADKLVEDTTMSSSHYTGRAPSTTTLTAVTHVGSIFGLAAERTRLQISIVVNAGTVANSSKSFDLSSGTSVSGASPIILPSANGFWRVITSGVTAAELVTQTGGLLRAQLVGAAGSSTYTGDGVSGLGLWGGQFEPASIDYPYETSLIPSAAGAATRDADNATATGAAFTAIYNAAAWGAYLRFHVQYAVGTRPILSFDDDTANNRIEIYGSGTSLKLKVVTGGAQQCDTTIGTLANDTEYKLAISQVGGVFLCTLNAAAEVTATAASMPTVDRARVARNQAGNYLNSHVHTWDAYRRAIPVLERNALTT